MAVIRDKNGTRYVPDNEIETDKTVSSDLAVVTSHQSWCTCKPCNRTKLDNALKAGTTDKSEVVRRQTDWYHPEKWYKTYDPEDKVERLEDDIEDMLSEIRIRVIKLKRLEIAINLAKDNRNKVLEQYEVPNV